MENKVTRCPVCGALDSLIIDSRLTGTATYGFVRRRRECQSCGQRWSTMELPYETGQKLIRVIKAIKEFDDGEV